MLFSKDTDQFYNQKNNNTYTYKYLDYLINLDNNKTNIKIKITNSINNNFFEKNITINDISLGSLDKYYSLVQNCLLNKPGCKINFNEYPNKIDMTILYETEFIDLNETISINKTFNEIEILQNKIIELTEEIEKLKLNKNNSSNKIQIGYTKKIIGKNLSNYLYSDEQNINPTILDYIEEKIEFNESTESIEYLFENDIQEDNNIFNTIMFENFIDKFINLKKIKTNNIYKFCNKIIHNYKRNFQINKAGIYNMNNRPETYHSINIYYIKNLEELTITGYDNFIQTCLFPNLLYLEIIDNNYLIIDNIFNMINNSKNLKQIDIKKPLIPEQICTSYLPTRLKCPGQVNPNDKCRINMEKLQKHCTDNNIILNWI